MNKFFLGAAVIAAMGLTACSNEDPAPVNGGADGGVKGTYYVAVRLNDTNASRGSSDGYQDAVAGEHEVGSADFYFYDENGIFVSKASAWDDKTAQTPANDNINFKSNMVVVLKDLDKKGYPKYMVTILNQPTGFVAPATMADMEKALAGGIYGDDGKFIMATTSFRGSNTKPEYYFATELTEANFAQDVYDSSYTPAEVYVERLAARVNIGFASSAGLTQAADGTYYKKIKITAAGDINGEDTDLDDNIGAEYVFIHILGWGLNAVAKDTHMVKNIDYTDPNDWDNFVGFDWDNPLHHRSYWGKSYNYGDTKALYPANDASAYNATPWTPGTEGYPLQYTKYSDITTSTAENKTLDAPIYCPENTNTGEIVSANGSAITSVLLKAVISSDEAHLSPINMIRYRGVMYTTNHYKRYMLNVLNNKPGDKLNYYYCVDVDEDTHEYYQIDENYIVVDETVDGLTKILLDENKFVVGDIYYKTIEGGKEKFYAYTSATAFSALQTELLKLNDTAQGGYEALAYNGGMMYYNIPIEHLATNTASEGNVSEAVYGIVRNHSYNITVNTIGHIGQGIFNPDKAIIVDEPTPEQELWNVGATINILSWKIVSQGVDL